MKKDVGMLDVGRFPGHRSPPPPPKKKIVEELRKRLPKKGWYKKKFGKDAVSGFGEGYDQCLEDLDRLLINK